MFAKHQGDVESILYELNVVDPLVIRRLHRELVIINRDDHGYKKVLAEIGDLMSSPRYIRPTVQLVSIEEVIQMYDLIVRGGILNTRDQQLVYGQNSELNIELEELETHKKRQLVSLAIRRRYANCNFTWCCLRFRKRKSNLQKINVAATKFDRKAKPYLLSLHGSSAYKSASNK
ncbi:hypothetical protein ACOME3_001348 [Neoechinorhynchus agilis]